MINVDKVREERQLEGVERWIKHSCKGTFFYATGVGKTYTALLAIDRIEKQRKPIYLITVPSYEVAKQWERQIEERYSKNTQERILIRTAQTLIEGNVVYDVDVLIVDESHEFASEERIRIINGELVKYKAILALTASADDKHYSKVKQYAPIIDIITEEEAKEKGFIAEFIEYNLSLSLTADEQKYYDSCSQMISDELPKFNNDLTLAQRCISGGKDPKSGFYYAADNWALGLAIKKGWHQKLNLRYEEHRELDNLWNPGKIVGYALRLMKGIRNRRSVLIHAKSKYDTTAELINKFNKVKTIVFSESTDFADKVYENINNKYPAVVYHSNLKTLIRPSEKTGKPIKVGAVRRKREAVEAIRSGKSRIIVTSKALDKGFDVQDLRFGLTASGTQNPTQYKQRGGRVKRKELNIFDDCMVLLVNLYIKNSQDEKWLKNRQKNALHKIFDVENIDNISYVPPANSEYSADI